MRRRPMIGPSCTKLTKRWIGSTANKRQWHGRTNQSRFAPILGQKQKNSRNFHSDQEHEDVDWMVRFKQARLQFVPKSQQFNQEQRYLSVDLDILRTGGHLLVGRNAAGKSLLLRSLRSQESVINTARDDNIFFLHRNDSKIRPLVSHVSFESHQQLLLESATSPKGSLTTYAVLSPDGHFSKTAEFLVVRFGLYPLLYRDVETLSTGEIRKVMLIRALVQQPRILILDNAFDGLDVTSRSILKDIVRKTIAGFRMDILVQGVSAQSVPEMQVVLATHRSEEFIDNISRISVIDSQGSLSTHDTGGTPLHQVMKTISNGQFERPVDREAWNDDELPDIDFLKNHLMEKDRPGDEQALITMDGLEVKGGDNTLLHDLTWTLGKGERWLIAGGNGAGKSTLSRLLVHPSATNHNLKGIEFHLSEADIAWVSTERHMDLSTTDRIAKDILNEGNRAGDELQGMISRWFNLVEPSVLGRPFSELSQGEQKVILIANALLKLPQLLILDEPLQGLDSHNRDKVLGIVERWCQASRMSFVYITHHLEESIPSIRSVLHLSEGRVVYKGDFASYEPDLL